MKAIILTLTSLFLLTNISCADIYTEMEKCTVSIWKGDTQLGSGVCIIKKDKLYVLTCTHVAKAELEDEDESDVITFGKSVINDKGEFSYGFRYSAKILFTDLTNDISVLECTSEYGAISSAKFDFSGDVYPRGTKVFMTGFFLDYRSDNKTYSAAANGYVGQVNRVWRKTKYDFCFLPVCGGCSGCGVFLENGKYFGMVCAQYTADNVLVKPIRIIHQVLAKKNLGWLIEETETLGMPKETK